MAKLIYALNQSLDGYIDHNKLGSPGPVVFRHFVEHMRSLTAMIYGRHMYEIMRYWDEDLPEWNQDERDFAAAWRSKPKWVISHTLKTVGPNATLISDDTEAAIRKLKTELTGEIEVGGTVLAQSLTQAGLIDEYQVYLRPIVLGSGKPFFTAPPPPLHLLASDPLDEGVIRLTYVPA